MATPPTYGDGRASLRIRDIIHKYFKLKDTSRSQMWKNSCERIPRSPDGNKTPALWETLRKSLAGVWSWSHICLAH
jgi:hypothetical protein